MGEGMFAGRVVVVFAIVEKALFCFGRNRRVIPLTLGFEEERERICANVNGIRNGILNT